MAGSTKRARKSEPTMAPAAKVTTPAPVEVAPEKPKLAAVERPRLRVKPSEEAIRLRAWLIWQREGCPDGRDRDHWLQAERELIHEQENSSR